LFHSIFKNKKIAIANIRFFPSYLEIIFSCTCNLQLTKICIAFYNYNRNRCNSRRCHYWLQCLLLFLLETISIMGLGDFQRYWCVFSIQSFSKIKLPTLRNILWHEVDSWIHTQWSMKLEKSAIRLHATSCLSYSHTENPLSCLETFPDIKMCSSCNLKQVVELLFGHHHTETTFSAQ
jgi:hypothetical protein